MCGICGIYTPNQQIDRAVLQAMNDAIRHRGPDDEGFFVESGVGLANRRLSIIDLVTGHQPMSNEACAEQQRSNGSIWITFNGEIYNYRDLMPALEARGHRFRTKSDTEVILHLYEDEGAECVQKLNGMFAFAIWDARTRTLLIARDRIGEKPLYYYRNGNMLVFGSEIKAILQNPAVPRALNPRGLANFLAFGHAVAPETIYQNIFKLLPGHYLLANDSGIQVVQYWDVGKEPQLESRARFSEEEYAARVLELLDDSVRRRMIADVPVGAFLSGGLDSSAVVALMKKHSTAPVKTFSLGFSAGGAYNELADARRVAQFLQTDHHELLIEHLDLVQTLRTLVYHYDEPFGDAAGFPIYLLSKFAREQVTVVLTGDGGDELFGGYRRYAVDQFAALYNRLPGIVTRQAVPALVDALPRLRRTKRIVNTLSIADPAQRYAAWLVYFTPEMQAELLQSQVRAQVGNHDPAWTYPHFYSKLDSFTAADHLNRLMYVDLKTWLVDMYLEKTDKASMACSLEARLPFLDHRLVELAFQIPARFKIQGLSTKRILKRAVRSLVPPEVLHKPKHGFAVPTDPWFRGDLKDFTFEILLDQRARQRGYFNISAIERLWNDHASGRRTLDSQLWLLLNFELWHRIFLDGDAV